MGLNAQFKTDKSMETKGIIIDYGKDRVRVARAGGANKKYEKMLERKTQHMRRALAVGAISNDQSNSILREVFSETVILGWEVNTGTETVPKWEKSIDPVDAGMEPSIKPNKALLPVTPENIRKVFLHLPDLFVDIQQQAQVGALYRQEINEGSAGN